MPTTEWTDHLLRQLEDAWHKHAYEQPGEQLALDAVAGFVLAVELAAAPTNDDMLDAVARYLTATAAEGREVTDILHAALLNLAVTFVKPALDALATTEHDVRGVAAQMAAVIASVTEEVP